MFTLLDKLKEFSVRLKTLPVIFGMVAVTSVLPWINGSYKVASSIVDESKMRPISVSLEKMSQENYFFPERFWKVPIEETIRIYDLTKQEDYKKLMLDIDTPLGATLYSAKMIKYRTDDEIHGENYFSSFKEINETRVDDCDGGAIAAAALLSDDGFPSYVARVSAKDISLEEHHTFFVYKTPKGKFGSLGQNRTDNQWPDYDSMDELKRAIEKDMPFEFGEHEIYNLKILMGDFINSERGNLAKMNVYVPLVNLFKVFSN